MSDSQLHAHPPRSRGALVLAILGALSLLCALAVFLAIVANGRSSEAMTEAENQARLSRRSALLFTQALLDMETGQRGYLLTGASEFLEPYRAGKDASQDTLTELMAINRADPALRGELEEIDEHLRELEQSWSRSIEQRQAGALSAARVLREARRDKERMDDMRARLDRFLHVLDARIEGAGARETNARGGFLLFVSLLGLLAVGSSGLALWTLSRERRVWRRAAGAIAEANIALEKAHAAAKASDESKTRFLATASHDMRQPLHALSLYLSALQRRVDTPETKRILDNMERATQSMINMFAQLLDLARIQSGVLNVAIEDFDVHASLTKVAAEFGADKVSVAPTTLAARTDPHLLESILRNFAANAIKHGGGKARLEARARDGGVLVCVVDQGPGVPPHKISDIFTEFTQLEGASKAEGLGIGLSIVNRIAERLALPIVVENNPGGGALFGVIAPLAPRARAALGEARVESGALKSASIIMIDDDPAALAAAAQIARDAGAAVATGESPEDLDALIESGAKPLVLVIDLRLQGMLRGIDVANAAREKLARKPAVLVVTGDTAPETLSLLQKSGYGWLIKPVDPDDFVATLDYAALRALHGGSLLSAPALP